MSLSIEEVKHVAELARLNLTDDEVSRFQGELSRILDYINQLREVDTDGVEPTAQVTGLTNRLREDVAIPSDEATRQRLLDAAPERDGESSTASATLGLSRT